MTYARENGRRDGATPEDGSGNCPKCGGHGFDPELVEAVAEKLYIERFFTWKWGQFTRDAHPGNHERDGALAALSVVRERLER